MPSINLKRLPTIGQCGHSDRPDCRLPQTSNDDCCPISTTTTTTTTTNQRSPILISTTSDHRNQSPSSTSITSSLNSSFFSSIITPSSSSSQSSLLFGRRTSLATVYGLLSLSLSLNVVLSQGSYFLHLNVCFTALIYLYSPGNFKCIFAYVCVCICVNINHAKQSVQLVRFLLLFFHLIDSTSYSYFFFVCLL